MEYNKIQPRWRSKVKFLISRVFYPHIISFWVIKSDLAQCFRPITVQRVKYKDPSEIIEITFFNLQLHIYSNSHKVNTWHWMYFIWLAAFNSELFLEETDFPVGPLERQKVTYRMPSTNSVCEILVVRPKAWRLTPLMVYPKDGLSKKSRTIYIFKASKSNTHRILIIIGVMLLIYRRLFSSSFKIKLHKTMPHLC